MSFFGGYLPLEYFMVAGIGFLAAWLTALMVFPAVHNRAVRLTRKEYDTVPLSMREMQAEKDQIRAGFSAATRKLELSIEQLKEKTAAHATDLARKANLVGKLKDEIDKTRSALGESEIREAAARTELQQTKLETVAQTEALHETQQHVANLTARVAGLTQSSDRQAAFIEAQQTDIGRQQAEIKAQQAEITVQRAQLSSQHAEITGQHGQLAAQQTEIRVQQSEISAQHAQITTQQAEIETQRTQLAMQHGETERQRAQLAMQHAEIEKQRAQIVARPAEFVPLAPIQTPYSAPVPLSREPSRPAWPNQPTAYAPAAVPPPPVQLLTPSPRPTVAPAQPSQHYDDSVTRAWTEIEEAARRVDAKYDGIAVNGHRPRGNLARV